jgi:uncharacterized protein involved in oxidation of intracellular sulfur
MRGREFKDALFAQYARIAAAFSSPQRIEIIDVLAQGERSVETLSRETGLTLANASRHLQILKGANLVTSRKKGLRTYYRLADRAVFGTYRNLRTLARGRLAEVERLARESFGEIDGAEPVDQDELLGRVRRGVRGGAHRGLRFHSAPGTAAPTRRDLPEKDHRGVLPWAVLRPGGGGRAPPAPTRLRSGAAGGRLPRMARRGDACRVRKPQVELKAGTNVSILMILNDPPYGTERTYNGLRLALNILQNAEGHDLTVFLMGDAVSSAKTGQQTPSGYYNVERMLKGVLSRKGRVLLCGSCMDARGLREGEIVEGCRRSSLDELASATLASQRVLVF